MSELQKPRGFACLTQEQRRTIPAKGGQTSQRNGTSHKFTHEKASEAGKTGGAHWKDDPEHMRTIRASGGKAKKGYRERREQQQLEQQSAEQHAEERKAVAATLLAQDRQSVEAGREPSQQTKKDPRR